MMNKILVIGGGAAGTLAAITAARAGAKVTLWEKNEKIGKKLAITGKGRCNLTNASPVPEIIQNLPGNGSFLYGAINRFNNEDVMAFFRELGVPLKVERGQRVFPVSDKALDIVNALLNEMKRLKVDIHYKTTATALSVKEGQIEGAYCGDFFAPFEKVIIATGGISYPATGSTGDGYEFAKAVGHTIIPLDPSLVPLVTEEKWVSDAMGLALKNTKVQLWADETKLSEDFGEMLFTHFGVSGPVILSLSKAACAFWQKQPQAKLKLYLNLKPALTAEQLDARIQKDWQKYIRKEFQNSLSELLPKSLIPVIVELSGIDPHKPVHQVTKAERLRLTVLLQKLPLTVTGTRPIAEAIVTAGGVNTKEINPKTMESKLVKGLYFVGEVIDVDGYTGGYNLQAAFSSAWVAATAAAEQ